MSKYEWVNTNLSHLIPMILRRIMLFVHKTWHKIIDTMRFKAMVALGLVKTKGLMSVTSVVMVFCVPKALTY